MKNPRLLLTVLLMAAAAVPVRAYGLGAKCLWLDEAMSVSLLDYGPIEIVARCSEAESVHPPLYFVFLKFWSLAFGDSEVALRSLSLALGLAMIAGVYLVSDRLARFDRRDPGSSPVAPLVAALLVALSPMQIELSRTVRGYTLAMALLTFSAWSLLGALQGPARGGRWVSCAVIALAACYTHHLALLSVAAGWLFAAAFLLSRRPWESAEVRDGPISSRRSRLGWPAAATLVFSVGYLAPWLPRLFSQVETIRHGSWSWPITWKNVLGQTLDAVGSSYDVGWYWDPEVRLSVTVLLVALMVFLATRGGWGGRFLAAVGLLPPLMMVAFSLHSDRSLFHARYLCFSQLAWLSGVAYAIDMWPDRPLRWALTAYVVSVSVIACVANWGIIGPDAQPGLRGAIRSIIDRCEPGELVVAETPYAFFGAKYYARGALDVRLCAHGTNRRLVWGSEHYREDQLITPGMTTTLDLPGIWVLRTNSYDRSLIVPIQVPEDWKVDERLSFDQDRFLEKPVSVTHFRPRDRSPRRGLDEARSGVPSMKTEEP